jgi:hypothetical protein
VLPLMFAHAETRITPVCRPALEWVHVACGCAAI